MDYTVVHYSDKPNRPPICGSGYYSYNPPTTDKTKVNCKRCLQWIEDYQNKK